MTITAKVILDSVAPNGVRITTSELTYPRLIHSDLMTHRVFSRNAASSRAIPTPKKIERIRKDCAKPSEWGVNQKGMQAAGPLPVEDAKLAEAIWEEACQSALTYAELLSGLRCENCAKEVKDCKCGDSRIVLDLHKQVANRILEPFDHITTVVTTTKLNNHRKLRTEVDANGRPMPDPTYFELATKWHAAVDASKPTKVGLGEWHLPYVLHDTPEGRFLDAEDTAAFQAYFNEQPYTVEIWGRDMRTTPKCIEVLKKVSVGRVARTSYMRQGQGDIKENIILHDRLASAGHWSPFEGQATPIGGFKFVDGGLDYAGTECPRCTSVAICKRMTKRQVLFDGHRDPVCQKCALGHVTSGNFLGWAQYRKEFPNEAGGDD